MKKLTVLFAILFSAGSMMAQSNLSTIDQSGTGNAATVDQQGSDHESIIHQSTWGAGHDAVVNQNSGSGNFSDILQDQRGWGNTSEFVDGAYIDQIGSDNESRLKQSGPNKAEIYQEGDENIVGGFNNYSDRAFQKNGTSVLNDRNELDVDQIGNGNKAGVWQEHHAIAKIEQLRDNHEAKIFQTGAAGGDFNEAIILQSQGNSNLGVIEQRGEGNWSKIRQQKSLNEAYQYTTGDYNWASSNVHGTSNYTIQTQIGDGNWSYLAASSNANDNTMTSEQNGFNNSNKVYASGTYSDDNTVYIDQDGSSNKSYSLIVGDNNSIDVKQDGIGNISGTHVDYGIIQTGNFNTADLDQLSDYNTSTINQTGDLNTSTVIQN